jgi:DNA-binding transcriptional ArsR family regulator
MSQPAISRHLRVLERAGLIAQGKDAQRRPRRLDKAGFTAAAEWIGSFEQFWNCVGSA